ncbi:MAG: alpha-L-fucosidase, partial [Bacteroidales bacterium]|nr:alpha-L-fucosidase [Bacteroidales bacterium]
MKSKSLVLFLAYLLFSFSCFSQVERPKSITEREYPKWFSDAKLGIFIHFGLYSVPSWSAPEQYAEWFYKGLISGDSARINFQKRVFGENFKYEEYKNIFKAELFDANEWANLFKRSGAKYVLFTSKHHDGYAMWNSAYSKGWNSYETAPKRDFCQELTDAVRAKGLEMGLYYSLTEWTNPLYRWTIDTNISIENYVRQHMHPQFKELVTKFRPSIIFSDGDWDHSAKAFGSDELVDWYYKTVGEKAIVNDRWGGGFNHGFITPEYSAGIIETSRPWAECRGIGRSFGLNRNESIESYKSSEEIIRHFVKLVAGGGGLTLNVGPSADGKIPLLQQERLLDLGNWLSINGEAIYGSKPFTKQYEQWDVNRVDKERDFESIIDFDWVRNSPSVDIPEDNFSIIWTSKIRPSYEEEYTITCNADDYAKVYLDNRLIIDTRDKTNSKNIKLKKDKDYNIEVKYFE